ncbi:MAG: hypothetical protein GWN47_04240 [Woeseiaceae bacterium]|nr:hypothetical protein [Woeseiaceae bacterium]
MCLVVVAYDIHDSYRLVVAGNRDEFHSRPTREAHWWEDEPDIAGGRDLLQGGTWLAMHRNGRFATVTNFRGAGAAPERPLSRGHLVSGFLRSELAPLAYLQSIQGDAYAGFNLIVADKRALAYCSNRGDTPRELAPGVYGLANTRLDAHGERIGRPRDRLNQLLNENRVDSGVLMELLDDRESSSTNPLDAPFVVTPEFGTRCSTTVMVQSDGSWQLAERRYDPSGNRSGETLITEHG